MESGKTATGALRYIARFPNRREPDTSIMLFTDGSGKILRYVEDRGVPRPGKTVEELRAQMDQMVRTHIQLDYVTGEGSASNLVPNNTAAGVRGAVADFDRSPLIPSVADRAAVVRKVCGQ